ncbi:NlpC/P60 family protein [Prosthecobacter fusiformis]|uniref:NlpC/P60 family protein n=1 Tax=Prosthecobacter fusiformis TaxID=48464 RepID=A0A4R7SPB6_9BACT|nr:NlpC/P60 family protein [Prosthecobacter fusiformis]TDU80744.1 NlpC/P60 family protein [Prosthecobacter fusiformis]
MKTATLLLTLLAIVTGLSAEEPDRKSYQSPYQVKFSFEESDLIGDLLTGPRSDWKDHASVPYGEWYNPRNQVRWGYRGPAARHFDPPPRLASKSPDWSRERIIATGLRFVGYSYQHHHVPDWDPPADWTKDADQTTPAAKGVDCSNFTAFVYNLALGIKPTGDVRKQAEMTDVTGPGPRRTSPVRRIELPKNYEEYNRTLLTGDLLYINNTSGALSHVVLWVGAIGDSPDGTPLILDSTGSGSLDASKNKIPDGIYLRPFTPRSWYFRQASHALRIIPDGPKTVSR